MSRLHKGNDSSISLKSMTCKYPCISTLKSTPNLKLNLTHSKKNKKTIQTSRHEILRTQCFILFEVSKKNTKKCVPHTMAVVSFVECFTSTQTTLFFSIFSEEDSLRDKQQNKYVHDKPCVVSLNPTVYLIFMSFYFGNINIGVCMCADRLFKT